MVADEPSNPATLTRYQNAQQQNGYGFELEARVKWSEALTVKANFSRQISDKIKNVTQADGSQQLLSSVVADAPKNTFDLALDLTLTEQWSAHLDTLYINGRHREPTDPRPTIANYWLTNFHLSYQPSNAPFTLAASIKNLFDADIREPSDGGIVNDFKMPTRQWLFELEYQF